MIRTAIVWLAAFTLPAVAASAQHAGHIHQAPQLIRHDGEQLVRVVVDSQETLDEVSRIATTIWNCRIGVGPLDVQVDADGLAALHDLGLVTELLIDDVQVLIDEQMGEIESRRLLRDITWFENYHTFAEINTYLDGLVAAFPTLISKITIGTSIEGRPIHGMRITGPGAPPARPVIIYNGGQHAREWISPATMMYIADQLANGYGPDSRITTLLDNVEFVIIPVTNPDGYEHTWNSYRLWRKNRRDNGDGTFGVDLNRNWSYLWGGEGSSGFTDDDIYRGTAPFSEPETTALSTFANNEPNLVAHIDWHSYSQLILYPFGGEVALPPEPDNTFFANLSQDMSDEIMSVHAEYYQPIASYQLYVAAGDSTDWFYGTRGVFSWTIELRPTSSVPGFQLPPDQIIAVGEETFPAVLLMAEEVSLPLRMSFASTVPGIVNADTATPVSISIENGVSALTPGGARLYSRIDSGSYASSVLTDAGGGLYDGLLPPAPCGSTIEFYAEADADNGSTVTLGTASAPFSTISTEITLILSDNAETDIGWTVSGDAADGHWDRGVPVNAGRGDPAADADGSGQAWLTDNDAANGGNSDVDDGTTILTSPAFDLSDGATVSWSYWFNDIPNGGVDGDSFRVDISTNGVDWTNIRSTSTPSSSWRTGTVEVGTETATSSTVSFRFMTDDIGNQNVIEAGLDAFRIEQTGCSAVIACSEADVTTQGAGLGDPGFGVPDGQITAADINFYINLWVAQDLAADFTTQGAGAGDPGFGVPDGQITAADVNYFVNLWVVGCP